MRFLLCTMSLIRVNLYDFRWKVESNPYRKSPWHLTNIPTIIKLDNVDNVCALAPRVSRCSVYLIQGKEVNRLVDREITAQNLKLLVKEG